VAVAAAHNEVLWESQPQWPRRQQLRKLMLRQQQDNLMSNTSRVLAKRI